MVSTASAVEIIYPDSDGRPMADNTIPYQYLITIQVGLDALFSHDPNVFVAGDLLWYPVQGQPGINKALDVFVAFGRPKGERSSYKQWEEGDIAPQVVFEILSPSNTASEMHDKRRFYKQYGVEEYYEYDPQSGTLEIWQLEGRFFRSVPFEDEWRSPRLGVTLKLEADGSLGVYHPNGSKFERPVATVARAEAAEARAAEAQAHAERLAAKLRELGLEPE
jgi:Uma2 family endonuclease